MAYQFTNQRDATIKYYPNGDNSQKATLTLAGINSNESVTADLTANALNLLMAIGGMSATYIPTNSLRTVEQKIIQGE